MNKKITHIVESFLWDRPGWKMPESYLKYRLEFFKEFTLRSILNQSRKDFIIFLQLGNRFRKITDDFKLPENVIKCYNYGIAQYTKIKSDYLITTRIDSDDCFHRDAIKRIRENVVLHPQKRTVSVFKKNLCWDMINGCIVPHEKATSPFFTQVFPRKIYRNWNQFIIQHFAQHGNHGAGDRAGKELPMNHVLIMKHGKNVSLMKRDLPPFKLSEEQIKILKETNSSDYNLYAYEKAFWDQSRQAKILSRFGLDRQKAIDAWKTLKEKFKPDMGEI